VDLSEITFNPVKREIAKKLSNSAYGKLAERLSLVGTKTEYITTPDALHKILNDSTKRVQSIFFPSSTAKILTITHIVADTDLTDKDADLSNSVYASFVTAHARTHLWKNALNPLGPRAFYCDTGIILRFSSHLFFHFKIFLQIPSSFWNTKSLEQKNRHSRKPLSGREKPTENSKTSFLMENISLDGPA